MTSMRASLMAAGNEGLAHNWSSPPVVQPMTAQESHFLKTHTLQDLIEKPQVHGGSNGNSQFIVRALTSISVALVTQAIVDETISSTDHAPLPGEPATHDSQAPLPETHATHPHSVHHTSVDPLHEPQAHPSLGAIEGPHDSAQLYSEAKMVSKVGMKVLKDKTTLFNNPAAKAMKNVFVGVKAYNIGEEFVHNYQEAKGMGQSDLRAFTCEAISTAAEELTELSLKMAVVSVTAAGVEPFAALTVLNPQLVGAVPGVADTIFKTYTATQEFGAMAGQAARWVCNKTIDAALEVYNK